MKILVLDTNTLLRFLLNDIPEQAKKVEETLELSENGKIKIIIPQIVIFEIVYALIKQYQFKNEEVAEGLRKIIINKFLQVQDKDIFEEALKKYSGKLSLADCFIYFFAKKMEAELFTFDKNLQKALK